MLFSNSSIRSSISDSISILIEQLRCLFRPTLYPISVVSEALRMSRGDIILILKKKGYTTHSGKLTRDMLDVLVDNYVENLHKFFLMANAGLVTNLEKYFYFLSFRKLYKHDDYRYLDYAEIWEQIDEEAIRQTLINRVESLMPKDDYIDISCSFVVPREHHTRTIHSSLADVFAIPCQSLLFFDCSPKADDDADDFVNQINLFFRKSQTFQDYLFNVLSFLASDPTSGRSILLTPKARGTCSGLYVRRLLSPHRYCIFGSIDDEPDSVTVSECKPDYMNCSYGLGKDNLVPCRRA